MKNSKLIFLSEGRRMEQRSVLDVAKFFLSKNDENMTHKKLQKLCYYAYSWNLALRKQRLFRERFQAWVHGPVSPLLYSKYKTYGWKPIPADESPTFGEEELEVLEEVYRTYGQFTGDELESLTHSERPWIEARGDLAPYEPSQTVLKSKLIEEYYSNLYEQSQND